MYLIKITADHLYPQLPAAPATTQSTDYTADGKLKSVFTVGTLTWCPNQNQDSSIKDNLYVTGCDRVILIVVVPG